MHNRPEGRNPRLLLCLAAALLAFVVQSGELGSADTMHRLQTAHSFWTSEPAVFPNAYPDFGVHGRSSGASVLHNAPALHAEHDGKQLHLPADADGILLPIRMVAVGKEKSVADWLCGVWAEPAYAVDFVAGPPHRGSLPVA